MPGKSTGRNENLSFKKEVEEKLRKLMMLAAMLALVLVIAAPAALGQAPSAVVDQKGVATATAGGTSAKAGCPAQPPEATAGGVVAKAPCKPPPPPPPPPPKVMAPPAPVKAAVAPPPPPPPKMLPPTGGISPGVISLVGLGAGALLVGGGLLARRIVR